MGKAVTSESPIYAQVRAHLWQCYRELNGISCPWDASEGKILKEMIQNNPSWTLNDWFVMVSNRFMSDGVNGDRPRIWLKNISRYSRGPLNEFNRVKRDSAVAIEARVGNKSNFPQPKSRCWHCGVETEEGLFCSQACEELSDEAKAKSAEWTEERRRKRMI